MKKQLTTFITMALLSLMTGCLTTKEVAKKIGLQNKTPDATNYYLNEEEILNIQRVVMMPVHVPQVGLASELNIDNEFLSKLTATQLFEVVFISRENMVRRFGQRSFNSATPLSDALFQYLKVETDADAVVFFDITTYKPFRPLKMGVRAKMIRLPKKEVLWAVDEIYDTADIHTTKEATKYEKKYLSKFDTTKQYNSILISPTRFTAFVAEKSVLSLPENSLSRKF